MFTSTLPYPQELESQSAFFGEIELDYDDMYQSLYVAGEPMTFTQHCNEVREHMPDQSQEAFYAMIQEECLELGIDYEQVTNGRTNPLVVHTVNYKGEGEGLMLADEAKAATAGTFVEKYHYR